MGRWGPKSELGLKKELYNKIDHYVLGSAGVWG